MTVSAIASSIYQTAKKSATGERVWNLEWSKAMKNAWRKFMSKKISADILKKIGGQEWIKEDFHRVYFNDLSELFG